MKAHQDTNTTRIAVLETLVTNINKNLEEIKSTQNILHQQMNDGFSKINNRLWQNFYWMIAGFSGIFIILAKIKGWL